MPSIKTEVTELATALGMLDKYSTLDVALAARPPELVNVLPSVWSRLDTALAAGDLDSEFQASFENGRAFLNATEGLRGRTPLRIEWKGPMNLPGYDFLPADLRVDHVYLVSCKYLSKVLANSSPGNLFDRRLSDRTGGAGDGDWYNEVAGDAFDVFYDALRNHLGAPALPVTRTDLNETDRARIRQECGGSWPDPVKPAWSTFSASVSTASAARWNEQLTTPSRREEMLWRLLRFGPAPYFVLGSAKSGPLRLRIATPWDWRQHYSLVEFSIEAVAAGQPIVQWSAVLTKNAGGDVEKVEGHVQIRWSHGRFSAVEAKVYLDTAHSQVPGYFGLV
jgi:hypothetical protein